MEFSVIIPVYNGEEFLEECLSSMTRQNFSKDKHEVIIVDDGSTDSSLIIASKYCDEYPFFKVVKGEHKGVSVARNLGILNCSGDYFAFIDADDVIANFAYLPLLDIIRDNDLDLITYGYTSDKGEFQGITLNQVKWKFCKSYCPTSVWRSIYKREIITNRNILFNEKQAVYEDYIFNFKYSYGIKNGCGLVSQNIYYYRTRLNSVSQSVKIKNKNIRIKALKKAFYGHYIALQEMQTYVQENKLKKTVFYDGAIAACMQSYLLYSVYLKEKPSSTIKALNKIGFSLRSLKVKNIEAKTMKGKIKSELMYLMRFRFFFSLFSFIYRIFG